jgi:hypothetical protein
MAAAGLENLRQQGLEKFELLCHQSGQSADIFMKGKRGFSSLKNLTHLEACAQKLVCPGCMLINGQVAANCESIDPERQAMRSARIKSDIPLTLEQWGQLASKLPCEPNINNEFNQG